MSNRRVKTPEIPRCFLCLISGEAHSYQVVTTEKLGHVKRTSLAIAKKADRTAYNIPHSCRNEQPKMLHPEKPWSHDHAAHGYSRCGAEILAVRFLRATA